MKKLILIITDDSLAENYHLQNAIKRYFFFINSEQIEVKIFGHDNCWESLNTLNDTDELLFDFHTISDMMNYSKKSVAFYGIKSVEFFLWKEQIKTIFYEKLVEEFKHGGKFDLVNSKLGLLNIYCINDLKLNLNKNFLSECKNLLNEVKNKFYSENEKLYEYFPELTVLNKNTDEILKVLEKKTKIEQKDKSIINNNFIKIVNFISAYKR